MDYVLALASFVLGGVVTHVYHAIGRRRDEEQAKELRKVLGKLPEKFVDRIRNDYRERLSVLELNKMLMERTIDPKSDDVLSYKACPKCGSDVYESERFLVDQNEDGYYATPVRVQECESDECDWVMDEYTARGWGTPPLQ